MAHTEQEIQEVINKITAAIKAKGLPLSNFNINEVRAKAIAHLIARFAPVLKATSGITSCTQPKATDLM